ncbi:DUF3367 domain-containing protein [Myxococcota bacterium]|nr:DUF3367 domain-containing protein [Myxococcota bacterium]MBU1380802.1 DUF3367 domain-containing protein [Myxococcota bacterium]MBU1498936.1 DUF3367 domain-containing protein [Myxococcota bacterium]
MNLERKDLLKTGFIGLSFVLSAILIQGALAAQIISILIFISVTYIIYSRISIVICKENKERILDLLLPVLFLALILYIYFPLLQGKMPWIADHSVHQMKAWIFTEKILSGWQLTGWTNFASAGYPAEVLYPPLADYFIGFFRIASFGLLSWEQVYAYSFLSFLLFYYFSFFYLGKKFGGNAGAVAAGIFSLIDMGAFRQGGWIFMVRWGVWPLSFSLVLTLWALYFFSKYLEEDVGMRRAIIMSSSALLCHPMALLVLIPGGISIVWFKFFSTENRFNVALKFFWWSFVTLGVTAWWLFPFLKYAPDYSAHVSAINGTINNMAGSFMNMDIWAGALPWVIALALAGAVKIFIDQTPVFLLGLVSVSSLFVVFTTTTLVAGLGLMEYLPSLKHVQFPRFLLFIKGVGILSAAYFVSYIIRKIRNAPPLKWHIKIVFLVFISVLIVPLFQYFADKSIQPLKKYPVNPSFEKGMVEIAQELKKIKSNRTDFFRIAIDGGFGEHRHASFPLYADIPFVKLSFLPAETFRFRSKTRWSEIPRTSPELTRLNVAYVVSMGPSNLKDIVLIKKVENIYLYEFKKYSPERVYSETAKTEVIHFRDDSISVKVGDGSDNNEIRFAVHPFVRWKALVNGKQVPISRWKEGNLVFMSVQAPAGSTVKLLYSLNIFDIASIFISVFFIVILFAPHRFHNKFFVTAEILYFKLWRFVSRLFSDWWKNRFFRIGTIILAILLLFAISFLVYSWSPTSKTGFDLNKATVFKIKHDKKEKCHYFYPARFYCGLGSDYAGAELRTVDRNTLSGIFLHPSDSRHYEVSFKNIKLKSAIYIEGGIDDNSPERTGKVVLETYFDSNKISTIVFKRRGVLYNKIIDTSNSDGKKGTVSFIIKGTGVTPSNFIFRPSLK